MDINIENEIWFVRLCVCVSIRKTDSYFTQSLTIIASSHNLKQIAYIINNYLHVYVFFTC